MALFGLFGKKDHAEEVRRLVSKTVQKFGPPENRTKALEQLRELGTPEALSGLLQRFEVRVEPGITDDEEKAYVCNCLVEAGDKAVEPIRRFIERSDKPTWALRALEQLVPPAEVVSVVLATLVKEGPEYTRDPEKKITLLRYLEAHPDPRIAPAVVPFFADMSEDVRVAAVNLAATQAPDEAAREPLIAALAHSVEEKSERMRKTSAAALAKLGFSVKGHTPTVQASLPPGYVVDREGVVRTK